MKTDTVSSIDNVKKLWTLKLIVDSGSLRKAAQRAKVSPAAISQTLSTLEKVYKKPLILRKGNTIEPTKDALELLAWISPVFSALDNLDIKLRSAPPIAYVNLGLPEDFSTRYCASLFQSLKSVLPNIKLTIFNDRSEGLLKMLRQGKLCSAIVVADKFTLDSFYVQKIYEDRLGFFVVPSLMEKSFSELLQSKGVASIRAGSSSYMSTFLNQFNPKLKPNFFSDSFATVRMVASAGEAVAILPRRIAFAENGDLVEIFPEKPLKHTGTHTVSLVSEKYCDKEEADFLAEKITAVCNASSNYLQQRPAVQ